jgi:hypothetical protein
MDGGRRVRVVGLDEIVDSLLTLSEQRTYINDPVVMTMKVLRLAGRLRSE